VEFYQHRASPKIGLTPLIDVVFILLLFFMLASNFNRWQQMPVTASVSEAGATSNELVIVGLQLYADKRLQLNDGSVVNLANPSWLSAILKNDANTIFKLTPADDVTVQMLVDAVDELQQLGVNSVTFGQ